jgi:LacI family transcriptional regulator
MSIKGAEKSVAVKRVRKAGPSPVRLSDVAQLAKVSPASVSRVFNDPELVSEDVRERVMRAAQVLNWVPNGAAKALASLRSRTIGVLIPTLSHQNFADLIESLQRELGKAQYTLILGCIEPDPGMHLQQARKMVERGIDWMVLVGEAQPPALIELLKSHNVPFVVTYTNGRNSENICIGIDNYAAAQKITQHLLDLGHTRFAMLAHQFDVNDRIQQRIDGVRDTLANAGLGIRPQHVVRVDRKHISSARDGLREIMQATQSQPTAVVCTNDYIATGAIIEASALGIAVPRELSIVGFDDIDSSAHLSPPLTTIHIPAKEMGEAVARYILDSISGARAPKIPSLAADLIVRNSTAAPPKQSR